MIDLCFGDSERGSLKVAQRLHNSIGAVGTIGSPSPSLRPKQYDQSKALGGNSADVLSLSFALDVGDLSDGATSEKRKELLRRMLDLPYENRAKNNSAFEAYWAAQLAELDAFIVRAKSGEPVRIWHSDAPYSACGLHFALFLLMDCDCAVSAIALPAYDDMGDKTVAEYSSFGEVVPDRLCSFLPLERPLPYYVRRTMAYRWADLAAENAPLRAVVNGRLMSVPDDFYDHMIRKSIPHSEFVLARLIGHVLTWHRPGTGDWWLAQRVGVMVERGELRIVRRGEAPYKDVLTKA